MRYEAQIRRVTEAVSARTRGIGIGGRRARRASLEQWLASTTTPKSTSEMPPAIEESHYESKASFFQAIDTVGTAIREKIERGSKNSTTGEVAVRNPAEDEARVDVTAEIHSNRDLTLQRSVYFDPEGTMLRYYDKIRLYSLNNDLETTTFTKVDIEQVRPEGKKSFTVERDGEDQEDLLENVKTSLDLLKELGGNLYEYFNNPRYKNNQRL